MNIDPAATDIEPTITPRPATTTGFRSAAAVHTAAVRNGSKYQETTSDRRTGESMKPSASALRASAKAERRVSPVLSHGKNAATSAARHMNTVSTSGFAGTVLTAPA
jgi:hypothetical protein